MGRSSASDLVLADKFLSRKHARLFVSDGSMMVEDLGSRNGTLLNGSPVQQPTRVEMRRRHQALGQRHLVTGRRAPLVGLEAGDSTSGTRSFVTPAI